MADTITIRKAARSDLLPIDTLLARSYPKLLRGDYPPSVMVTAVPLIARVQPRLALSGNYYVAETEAGDIIGVGGWSPRGPGLAEVRHLVTDHRHLRRGVARAIVGHAICMARAAGARRMNCFSTRTAVPFYGALGFAEKGSVTVHLRPGIGFPAIRMSRAI